jgi:hypothetical protein
VCDRPLLILVIIFFLYHFTRWGRLRALKAVHTPGYTCPLVLKSFNRAQFTLKPASFKNRLGRVAAEPPAVSLAGSPVSVSAARARTLAALGSHGVRPTRIWAGLTSLRDEYKLLGGVPLCGCVPRAPTAGTPEDYHLCRRGTVQYSLLSLRARAIRVTLSGWTRCLCARGCPCARATNTMCRPRSIALCVRPARRQGVLCAPCRVCGAI